MTSPRQDRIAFFHSGISDLTGGGGAQRFFFFIFKQSNYFEKQNFQPYFLTESKSAKSIKKMEGTDSIKNLISVANFNNRFKEYLESFFFILLQLKYRFKIIHFPQYYHEDHYHITLCLKLLPVFLRPKIVINIVHSNLAESYLDTESIYYNDFQHRYKALFNKVKIDGVYSWYKSFVELSKNESIFKQKQPYVYATKHYCTDSEKFRPSPNKNRDIVWAARFNQIKDPLFYLESVNWLFKNHSDLLNEFNWKIYGNGAYIDDVIAYINNNNLDFMKLETNCSDLSSIFAESLCFVSTQHIENFTSLSMHEAMSSGNAILSKNVGQTDFYVEENVNGYLCSETPSAEQFGNTILKFLKVPRKNQLEMGRKSREIVENYHNQENFINELTTFYRKFLEY